MVDRVGDRRKVRSFQSTGGPTYGSSARQSSAACFCTCCGPASAIYTNPQLQRSDLSSTLSRVSLSIRTHATSRTHTGAGFQSRTVAERISKCRPPHVLVGLYSGWTPRGCGHCGGSPKRSHASTFAICIKAVPDLQGDPVSPPRRVVAAIATPCCLDVNCKQIPTTSLTQRSSLPFDGLRIRPSGVCSAVSSVGTVKQAQRRRLADQDLAPIISNLGTDILPLLDTHRVKVSMPRQYLIHDRGADRFHEACSSLMHVGNRRVFSSLMSYAEPRRSETLRQGPRLPDAGIAERFFAGVGCHRRKA
jgi:hypothetical protein